MIEELVAFTSTHLAMVTLLMPWKKIVVTDENVDPHTKENVLKTLWDMFNLDKWGYKMDGSTVLYDDSLPTMVNVFLSMSVVILAMAILGFGLRLLYPSLDPNIFSVVDFINWGLILGLLVTMLISQSDFDESWKFQYRSGAIGSGFTADTDKMFLPLGVVVVHLAMSSYFVGKDIIDRLRS
jgi:hypothetical protein